MFYLTTNKLIKIEEKLIKIKKYFFRHLGAEYGGDLSDNALIASSEIDYYFRSSRGRLNTPDDVVDFVSF